MLGELVHCIYIVKDGHSGTIVIFAGISKLYPDSSGTKLVVVDEKSDAFVYNPVIVVVLIENELKYNCNIGTRSPSRSSRIPSKYKDSSVGESSF